MTDVKRDRSSEVSCDSEAQAIVFRNRMLMAKILRNLSDLKDRRNIELCNHLLYKYSRQRGCPYLAPNIDNGYLEISYRGQLRALEVKIAGNTKKFPLQLSAAGWISSEAIGNVRLGLEQLLNRFRHQINTIRFNRLHFSLDLVDIFSVLRKVQVVSFSQCRFSPEALRWWLQSNNIIHQRVISYCFHRSSGNGTALNLLTNMLSPRLHMVCITGFNLRFFVEVAQRLIAVKAPIELIFVSIAPRVGAQEPSLESVLRELSSASKALHLCVSFPQNPLQGASGFERFKLLPTICQFPKVSVLELSFGCPNDSALAHFESFFRNLYMMRETLRVLHIAAGGIDNKLSSLTDAICIGLSDLSGLEELTIREFRDKMSSGNCSKIWANLPGKLRTFGLFTFKNFTHDQMVAIVTSCPLIENLVLLEVQQLRSKTLMHILSHLSALQSIAVNLWDTIDDDLAKILLNRQMTPSLDAVSLCFSIRKIVITSETYAVLESWFRFHIESDANFYEPYTASHFYRTRVAHERLRKTMRFGCCPACKKDAIVEM